MKINKHSQQIYSEQDICDLLMQGHSVNDLPDIIVDHTVNLETAAEILNDIPKFVEYNDLVEQLSTEEFDHKNQSQWFMPDRYKNLDIAEHVLNLCTTNDQLQRVGDELMLYQERNLFNLLRYLKYLVDTMTDHNVIWGVGRGSSVASYVLYLLGVHRIDSMYYDLDPREFLR